MNLVARHCRMVALIALVGCAPDTKPAPPPSAGTTVPPAVAPPVVAPPPIAPPARVTATEAIPAWVGQTSNEPFDVAAFLNSRATPADNAAPLYVTALKPLCGCMNGREDTPLEIEIRQLAAVEKLAANTVPPARIADILTQTAPTLALIDKAQEKPNCVFIRALGADALMPETQAMRVIARLAALQLKQSQTQNDFAKAEAAIRRAFRASRDIQRRGPEVVQLVSITMDTQVLEGIQRLCITDPQLTAEQIDRLLSVLQTHEAQCIDRAEEGLKMGYMCGRQSIVDLQTGRLTVGQISEFLGGPPGDETTGPLQYDFEKEAIAVDEIFRLALAATSEMYRPNEAQAFERELNRQSSEVKGFVARAAAATPAEKRQLFAKRPPVLGLLLAPALGAFLEANHGAEARMGGTKMLLALRRYQIVHGKLPPDLQQAAADCALKTVPVDPFDGKPLRWATVAGNPTVYSVGKDQKDDGDQSEWMPAEQSGDLRFVLAPLTR